ncbi:BnaA02g22540D [Brassica napus]|uniref:BnaA02g22540D protein n=1 Tax=Brassica napus TaxID=3708 RepID=A0A078FPX4_BRANA|nr:BnaA02g22540D [Brassica napus]
MSCLPPSVMLFAFVLWLLELQLEPWKRPPASGDTASGRVLSISDFGLSPADPDLLTETHSGAQPLHSSKSCLILELRPLASVGYCFPPTSQATSIFPITVVKYFTLPSEVVSTISGDSFASGPRLFSNPVESLVPLHPHCRRISFNATAIITSRFYGTMLYHLNLLLLVTAGSIMQECGFTRFAPYILTVASPSHYTVSSIDGSSHTRIYGPPNLLVAETIVQEPYLYSSNSCLHRLPSTSHCNSYSGSISAPHCNVGRSSHLQRHLSAALNSTLNSTSSCSFECRLEYYK